MKQLCKILYIGLCLMTFHKTIIFSDGLAIGCIKRGTHTCKKTAIVPKADGTVKTTKYLIAHQDITHICNILMVCLSWAFSLANGWLRLVAGCCRITVDCCNAEIGNFLYLCSIVWMILKSKIGWLVLLLNISVERGLLYNQQSALV